MGFESPSLVVTPLTGNKKEINLVCRDGPSKNCLYCCDLKKL